MKIIKSETEFIANIQINNIIYKLYKTYNNSGILDFIDNKNKISSIKLYSDYYDAEKDFVNILNVFQNNFSITDLFHKEIN